VLETSGEFSVAHDGTPARHSTLRDVPGAERDGARDGEERGDGRGRGRSPRSRRAEHAEAAPR
jgi:hypothetical protein